MNSNNFNYDKNYFNGTYETSLKNRFATSHLTTSNIKTKQQFQRKYEMLSQQKNNAEMAWKLFRISTLKNYAILRFNLCINEKFERSTHQGIEIKDLNKRSSK